MTFRRSSTTAAMVAAMGLAGGIASAGWAMAQTSVAPTSASKPASSIAATARPAANTPGDGQAATADQLFTLWDADKNRTLSLDEFKNGWESAREQNILGRLEIQFRAADKNKSGLIEAAEFANLPLIKRAGAGAPPMSAFDINKDQLIDFKEYLDLVSAMLKRLAPVKK